MRNDPMSVHATPAYGANQEPAKTSCKARVEARCLKAGDVIVRQSGSIERRDTVQEVRFAWWARAIVFTNESTDALIFNERDMVYIVPAPLFHVIAVNKRNGNRVKMTRYPMNASQCHVMIGKLTVYPWRELELQEAEQ